MKNTLKLSTLFISIFASSVALAAANNTAEDSQLVAGYNAIVVGDEISNASKNFNLQAIANRDGFVKNDFLITVSANVGLGVNDDDTTGFVGQRFAVIAGANRGRAVFTGTSEGGSVTQCGQLVAKDTASGGASLLDTANLSFESNNGCARTTTTTTTP